MKYRIYREKPACFSSGRSYLVMKDAKFSWIETADFETWDDCEAQASVFTEFETAILLMLLPSRDLSREYGFHGDPV
jgi:hypothetical protein